MASTTISSTVTGSRQCARRANCSNGPRSTATSTRRRAPRSRPSSPRGRDVLFDIDWQGTQQIKQAMPDDVVGIFVLPPSMRELRSRLERRAEDASEVIDRRLANARSEIEHWLEYDYVFVNKDLQETYRRRPRGPCRRARQATAWPPDDCRCCRAVRPGQPAGPAGLRRPAARGIGSAGALSPIGVRQRDEAGDIDLLGAPRRRDSRRGKEGGRIPPSDFRLCRSILRR